MKNFFEHQDSARKNSTRLIVLFGLAVLLTIVCLYFVTLIATNGLAIFMHVDAGNDLLDPTSPSFSVWWDFQAFSIATIATLAVVGGGTFFKIRELSKGGGSLVCEQLGGTFVDLRTKDIDQQRLINIVQEMSIASGVSVPLLYVLENEPSINAFAAGFSPNNAAIAVTRGALELLSRDELQGVIAHEFSHILNGDMRMNIRMIGVLHGILMIGVGGYTLMRLGLGGGSSSRRNKSDGAVPLILVGAALVVVGYGGRLIGRVIKSAVSRQREFLADASAVQFTRNPAGLAGALKKIGGWPAGSQIDSVNAEQISHMFFGNGVEKSYWFQTLFSTHPSLKDRVRRIDPYFSGAFPVVHPPRAIESAAPTTGPRARAPHSQPVDPVTSILTGQGLEGLKSGASTQEKTRAIGDVLVTGAILSDGGGGARPGAYASRPPLNAAAALESVGQMSTEHVDRARELIEAIPESIQKRAQDPFGAASIAFALLLDRERQTRAAQVALLRHELSADMFQETGKSTRELEHFDPLLRLPLLELLVPALRSMSQGQFDQFMMIVDQLIDADAQVTVFEFALKKLLQHRLYATHGPAKGHPQHIATFYSMTPLRPDIAVLLSFLADAGSGCNPAEARRAFELGAGALNGPDEKSGNHLPFLSSSERSFEQLDRALDRIAGAANGIKHRIVRATAACVLADQDVSAQEAQLLRVMCAVIDVPLPPFLPRPASAASAA